MNGQALFQHAHTHTPDLALLQKQSHAVSQAEGHGDEGPHFEVQEVAHVDAPCGLQVKRVLCDWIFKWTGYS